jgi:hypothetical protein
VTFLRFETVPITFAVFKTPGGEHRMGRSKVELRAASMMQHGLPCEDTQRALAEWPVKGEPEV